jgi:arsenate reductase (thioredoxin)
MRRASRVAWAIALTSCNRPDTATPVAPVTPPVEQPAIAAPEHDAMNAPLVRTIDGLLPSLLWLPEDRKQVLDQIATYVVARRADGAPVKLTFICTGNSRRSHLGQVWAAAAAAYYDIDGVETYSGGTEPSAFNPRAIAAIERAGFVVERPAQIDENPHYRVRYASDRPPIDSFSKRYDDPANPKEGFVAVMTCSEADESCPSISGAALRVSLSYDDPKVADGTPEEAERYDERSRQIATEMLYLFSRLATS